MDKPRCTLSRRLGARSSPFDGQIGKLPGPPANFTESEAGIDPDAIAKADSVLKLRAENPNPGAVSS
jgi:hypothetical protein